MKRVINVILLVGIVFFSYQGWVKFVQDEQPLSVSQSSTEQAGLADEQIDSSSTFKDSLDKVVGTLQSSVSSFLTEANEREIPVSVTQVSQSETEIVNQLAEYIQNRTNHFELDVYGERSLVSESMERWIDEALSSDDYTRYATQGYKYSIMGYSQYSEVSFEFDYRETDEQTSYVRSFVNDLLESNNVMVMNSHEKVKWIHDWIVRHVQYDGTLTKYTAYEALTERLAVCQGYALLGQMMLEEAGIESRIAEGEVATGSHAWNMVKLDGIWYHLDLTWDDPVGQAEDDVSYRYYLVSDDTLRKDHTWVKTYPTAAVDYKDVLVDAILNADSDEQRKVLQAFQQSLDLHWFEPEYTINNKDELTKRIKSMTDQRVQEVSFRYLNVTSLVADLKQAFQATNIGLSYQVQYNELSDQGDARVTVTVKYN